MKRRTANIIVYSHDGYSSYDELFLNALKKEYNVVLVRFAARRPVPKNVQVVEIPRPRIGTPLRCQRLEDLMTAIETPARLVMFKKYIHSLKPRLLIGCTATLYGYYAAVSNYKPFLLIVWGSDILLSSSNPLLRNLVKTSLSRAQGVIVDSEVQRKTAISLGCEEDKICMFPWGIDLTRFRPRRELKIREQFGWETNLIVISTRYHKHVYRVDTLIRAAALIVRSCPDVRFIIAGEGPLTPYLRLLARKLSLLGFVRFVGKIDNVPEYLHSSDIYVSTSTSDGTSASLLEAMACGLPVVVSDIPGNREWVVNSRNGYIFPSCNPSALSKAVLRLVHDSSLRRKMAQVNIQISKQRADWRRNERIFLDFVRCLAEA